MVTKAPAEMRLRITITVVLLSAILALVIAILDDDDRWLLIHGESAEAYAKALLRGDRGYDLSDRFIDYVVITENGYVMFSRHGHHDTVYAYNPSGTAPTDQFDWISIGDNWFRGNIAESPNP